MKDIRAVCIGCGKMLCVCCNESCEIVSVRCPKCLEDFLIGSIRVDQLRNYLKKNGWTELESERKEIIRFKNPKGNITFIPARRNLCDFLQAMRHALNSISVYSNTDLDTLLKEVLEEGGGIPPTTEVVGILP